MARWNPARQALAKAQRGQYRQSPAARAREQAKKVPADQEQTSPSDGLEGEVGEEKPDDSDQVPSV